MPSPSQLKRSAYYRGKTRMNCPDCGGQMWDNRPKKANGTYKATRSDFSCKDKDGCGKGVWLDGKKNGGPPIASNGNARQTGNQRALGPVYNECLTFAKAAIEHHFGKDVATADIIAGTATLFIQATKTGAPIRAPKQAPAPPPPSTPAG